MKNEVNEIIESRPITKEDLEGYKGFEYKSNEACIFEQNKCIERDIFGHDSYETYCTRLGESKRCISLYCERCGLKTTVGEYKTEKGIKDDD